MWSIWFWTLSFDQCKECSLHLSFVQYWLDLWADKWLSPRPSQWPVNSSAGLSCAPLAPFPSTIVDRGSLVQAQWKEPQLPWVHDYNGRVMSRRCHFCRSSPSLPSGSYVLTIASTSVLSDLYFRAVHSTVLYPSSKTSLYSWMFACKEKLPWWRLSVAFVYENKHVRLGSSLTHVSLVKQQQYVASYGVCFPQWQIFDWTHSMNLDFPLVEQARIWP